MQEFREDGTDELTPKATMSAFKKALLNEANVAVTMHKPSLIITRTDGSQYRVHTDGSLRKIKDKE